MSYSRAGLFDPVKIEALMREHGAVVQDYKGKQLITVDHFGSDSFKNFSNATPDRVPAGNTSMALAFIEPGLERHFGSTALVQHAESTCIRAAAKARRPTKTSFRTCGRSTAAMSGSSGAQMCCVRAPESFPDIVANQLPRRSRGFSFRGQVDSGLQARISAEGRDDESANMLRDVIRGFLALAKLQPGSKPEFQHFVQSLQLGGSGKTVSLSLDVPSQVFDALGSDDAETAQGTGASVVESVCRDRSGFLLRHTHERVQASRPRAA